MGKGRSRPSDEPSSPATVQSVRHKRTRISHNDSSPIVSLASPVQSKCDKRSSLTPSISCPYPIQSSHRPEFDLPPAAESTNLYEPSRLSVPITPRRGLSKTKTKYKKQHETVLQYGRLVVLGYADVKIYLYLSLIYYFFVIFF